MNVLNKLTLKSLQMNKKRTIVTIIGIILATSLLTAVITMVVSFRATMIEYEKEDAGNYHYVFEDVPYEDLKYFKNNTNIEDIYCTEDIGYTYLEGNNNDYKPYLHLLAFNEKALINSSVKLVEGRMPQNENEIVISEHIKDIAEVEYNIGDTLSLDVSKRTDLSGEYELDQSNAYVEGEEKLESMYTKEYKVVGIIERPNYDIENPASPGYTIVTYLNDNNATQNLNIYVLLSEYGLKNQEEFVSQITGIDKNILTKLENNEQLDEKELEEYNNIKYSYSKNEGLLRYENFEVSDSTMSTVLSLAVVVIVIIIVTSIFCIRNSFAISITEKMRQYGMLASVGATPKQIKKNVLYEAMILALIAIPIGILCGLFADFILLKVIGTLLADALNNLKFIFSISWLSLVFVILLAIITIYLSAISSARRASKISPIEAIRGNNDIKINPKKIRSSKIVEKLFGIGGKIADKNLKRNKKKYRTTVISIVVSVSIFIAMSSFIDYAMNASSVYYNNTSYNLYVRDGVEDSYKEIAKFSGVEEYSIVRLSNFYVDTNMIKGNEDFRTGDESSQIPISIIALGDEEYRRYVKELGLNYNDAKDKAILIDDYTQYVVDEENKGKYIMKRVYTYEKGDTILGSFEDEGVKDTYLEIAAIGTTRPMGLENITSSYGYLVISDDFYNRNVKDTYAQELYIKCDDSNKLEGQIRQEYDDLIVYNLDEQMQQEQSVYLVIQIFLYGFITVISLIGITNIFNTITTNMNLRSREFAMLKSIGMTNKEFNKMIRLESILYGLKSLLIGIPIGIILSYLVYKAVSGGIEMEFILPINSIIISIVVVMLLIIFIMRYSLSKINKQNIIETIRKDNI